MIHYPKSTNAKCIHWLLCFCAFLSLLLLLCGWARSMVTPAGRHSRILKTTTNHCSFPGGCKNAIAVAARQSTSHHIAISKNKHSPFDDPFCLHLRAHSMVFYFVFQIGWRTLNAENSNRIFTFDFKWNGNIRPHSDSHQIQPFHSHAHKMNLTVFCCCCLLHSRTFPFYLSHIVSVCCIPSERVKYYFGWCEFYGEIKTRINAIGRWPFIHIAICFHFGSSNRAKCPGSCA